MAAVALTSAGRVDAVRAAELARAAIAGVPLAEEEKPSLALFLPETLIFADQLEEAAGLLDAAIRDASRRGSLPGVALASAFSSQVAFRRGDLRDAEAHARTALKLVDPEVLGYSRPYILSFLVDALVEHGEYPSAESVLGEAGVSEDWPELWQFALLLASRGRLRLAQGRTAEGVADLLACGRRLTPWRPSNPGTVAWRSEAAIGLMLLGERGEAARLAEWELRHARAFGARRPLGVALRAAGLALFVDLRTIGSTGGLYADTNLLVTERGTRLLLDILGQLHDQLVDYALELADGRDMTAAPACRHPRCEAHQEVTL